jgi:hypothetical protein
MSPIPTVLCFYFMFKIRAGIRRPDHACRFPGLRIPVQRACLFSASPQQAQHTSKKYLALAHRVLLRRALTVAVFSTTHPILHRAAPPSSAALLPASHTIHRRATAAAHRPLCALRCCWRAVKVLPTPSFPVRRSWPLRCAISKRRCCDESTCYKAYVSSVSDILEVHCNVLYGCCKVDRGRCTCCFRGMAEVFQRFVQSVSSIPDICCKCSDLDVTYVS